MGSLVQWSSYKIDARLACGQGDQQFKDLMGPASCTTNRNPKNNSNMATGRETRSNPVPKFVVGEKVLCYEPDPNKARVLYESKVKVVSTYCLQSIACFLTVKMA